jgi:TetR/AcrR family transcriptional regulator, regulator of cefoperazone and chloramphenicol sensitivity
MKRGATQAATRPALLEAAGLVFAERGFRGTTVRQICRRAGANVAAINYHFGNKENLYLEVIRHAHRQALAKYPFDLGVQAADPAADRLRAYVRSFLLRIFDPGPTAWMSKLIAMEMINPSGALDSLVRERIRPMAKILGGIVAELLGPGAHPEQVRLCGLSVVSQCLFYAHCRAMLSRLYPAQPFDPAAIERLSNHITTFSLAALRQARRVRAKPRYPVALRPSPPTTSAQANRAYDT